MIFNKADILLPALDSYSKWAVVACDQFTSQPEYWEQVKKLVGDDVSSYHLILPEAELSINDSDRIVEINKIMEEYLQKGIFNVYENSYVYVERELNNGVIRKGIVGVIDLEDYDYTPTANTGIRATEKTVVDRLPPRVKIRENAPLELPHILLLCDDPEHQLLESIETIKDKLPVLYDFNLMQDGGHITGRLVQGEAVSLFDNALEKYLQETEKKYQNLDEDAMFFAVGDGNHSLAAAKKCYELRKEEFGSQIKARYALVELENLQDEAQKFEPIHRLLKYVDVQNLLKNMREQICVEYSKHKIEYYAQDDCGTLYLDERLGELTVGILQNFLDDYVNNSSILVDYIHDDSVLKQLSNNSDTIGFLLYAIDKKSLFQGIIKDGALPRKTFSMGHAQEKRYYMESRKIM